MIDFTTADVLTFDCYGTLIDWESGLLAAFRPVLAVHGAAAAITDDELLELYAGVEAELERGAYRPYRAILAAALTEIGARLGFTPSPGELAEFGGSVSSWPAFADSADALRALAARHRLAIISNVDDDLFASTRAKLGVEFDWIVTAQQVRSYKPSLEAFRAALARIPFPRERWVHVAQSLFHDHVPAQRLGLATAWINRRHAKPGFGATPPAIVRPDLETPDMATFASLVLSANDRAGRRSD